MDRARGNAADSIESRPSRARGLKWTYTRTHWTHTESRPSRARGLKWNLRWYPISFRYVAPFTGAWIEIIRAKRIWTRVVMSRPSRARGLKSYQACELGTQRKSRPSRARGLKSKNANLQLPVKRVAPFTGAWIEIGLH